MLNHIFMSSWQHRCGNRYRGLLYSLGRLAEGGRGDLSNLVLKPSALSVSKKPQCAFLHHVSQSLGSCRQRSFPDIDPPPPKQMQVTSPACLFSDGRMKEDGRGGRVRLRSNPEVEQFVGKSRLERVNEAQRLYSGGGGSHGCCRVTLKQSLNS